MCVGITCGQCKDNLRKSFFPFGLGLTKKLSALSAPPSQIKDRESLTPAVKTTIIIQKNKTDHNANIRLRILRKLHSLKRTISIWCFDPFYHLIRLKERLIF